ncbi:MAG: hypothetical protein ABIJ56_11970 [Pseudomonadota bacterium]
MTRFFALIAAFLMLVAVACDNGGNGEDVDYGVDTTPDPVDDTVPDVPVDTPVDTVDDPTPDPAEEEIPSTPQYDCVMPCGAPADCCLAVATCGTYPDKWACDGTCSPAGCANDGECVTYATNRSLPDPELYKCRAHPGGGTTKQCRPGCTGEADCCPGADCSVYPKKYVCDTGNCFLAGCSESSECITWATSGMYHLAENYICSPSASEGASACVQSCSSDAECCGPTFEPCNAMPYHYACNEGTCKMTCSTNTECVDYYTASSIPHAESYVCETSL